MKKLLALLLAMALGMTLLVACGGNEPAPAPAEEAPAETPAETPEPADDDEDDADDEPAPVEDGETIVIGLSMPDRDPWLSLLEEAAVEMADELGVEIIVFDAQNDVNAQISHIQSFVTQEVDAIVIRLVDASTGDIIVDYAQGTPIVFAGRLPAEELNEPGVVHFVGVQEIDAGIMQADFVIDYFTERGVDSIDYVLIRGRLDHPGATYRSLGFRQRMEESDIAINNVFDHTANFDRAEAMDLMQQFLGTGQNFDVVISNNDEMAIGAIEALRAVGITDIPVLGVDASPHGVASIAAGDMAASTFQSPRDLARITVGHAVAIARGEIPDTHTWLPFELVTAENVADYQ